MKIIAHAWWLRLLEHFAALRVQFSNPQLQKDPAIPTNGPAPSRRSDSTDLQTTRVYKLTAAVLALLIVGVGLAVMVGWLIKDYSITSLVPGFASMKFNTALCFVLLGTSILLHNISDSPHLSLRIADVSAATVLALGLTTLLQYALGVNTGLDEFFHHDPVTPAEQWPGRMSVVTAVEFSLFATALLLLPRSSGCLRRSTALVLIGLFTALIPLLGYTYGVKTFRLYIFSSIAIHTSILFVLSSVAILLLRPFQGVMKNLSTPLLGGRFARTLIPVVIIVQLLLGWLSFAGVAREMYAPAFGFALSTLLCMTVIVTSIWWISGYINQLQADIEVAGREREYLASIIANSDDAIVSKDLNGIITSWNEGAQRIYGYTAQEMLGRPMKLIIPPEELETEDYILARIARNERIDHLECIRRHKDGHTIPMSVTISPIIAWDGTVTGASSVARDISERRRANEALEQRSQQLLRSNQDLEQFAYVASHDLQEPLRAVSGCVQLLQQRYQGHFDQQADEFMSHAVDGARRMQTLIDDLLLYSRVGQSVDNMRIFDCNLALHTALKNLAQSIEESGVEITFTSLPLVRASPSQITLLFQNLLGNAIKFRRRDIAPKVDITVEKTAGYWQFQVRDNGIGIEEPYHERIFMIFQRLHTRREYPGTGIGLALCQRIVLRHDGKLWLQSQPGVGTTMFFTLPEPGVEAQSNEGTHDQDQ